MGSLSRNFDGWRNHVMMNARHSGTGGQMAVLMQQELESISDGTNRLAALQQREIGVMKAGFDEMADSMNHLAWVQQRAAEAQLDAQYRLARIQSETNAELRELNETAGVQTQILAHVSSQLDDVTTLLRAINDSTLEHNNAVKAERLLKEVLFQLGEMLDNMILPDDPLANLFLSRTALEVLDNHGLGTQHLSDLADKRVFADFVKKTRQTVRDTDKEVQADLVAFETWYKDYEDACRATMPSFKPGQEPENWKPGSGPVWRPRYKPSLHYEPLREPAPPPAKDSPRYADWEQVCKDIAAENELVSARNERLHAEFAVVLDNFTQDESARRAAYEAVFTKHCDTETQRYASWQDAVRTYLHNETERRRGWNVALEAVLKTCIADPGHRCNAFLGEHPDCQLVYSPLNVDGDLARIRSRAKAPIAAHDTVLENWQEKSGKDMPRIAEVTEGPPPPPKPISASKAWRRSQVRTWGKGSG